MHILKLESYIENALELPIPAAEVNQQVFGLILAF
jgi:hypothetical protein